MLAVLFICFLMFLAYCLFQTGRYIRAFAVALFLSKESVKFEEDKEEK